MVRSICLMCLLGAAACFMFGQAFANHEHYDGGAHVGKLQPNTMHPMGQGHHAHTDGSGKIMHMSRNGQRHAKVFGAKAQKHQNGRKVIAGMEIVSGDELKGQEVDPEECGGANIVFIGFAFDLGNNNYAIFWFPVNFVVPNIQINIIL